MINGIYQSATGMDALARLQETLANNLANVSTSGFKQALADVEQTRDGRLAAAVRADLGIGPLRMTGGATQLALTSEGFFVVETPGGEAYTRNGDFRLDADGRLVTAAGHAVQGGKGAILIGGRDFTVNELGEVLVRGEVVDRLRLVRGDALRPAGNGLFTAPEGAAPEDLQAGQGLVLQGALENSNVNLVKSMVDMLAVVRLYEANQKALESQDETLKQAVSQVGRTL